MKRLAGHDVINNSIRQRRLLRSSLDTVKARIAAQSLLGDLPHFAVGLDGVNDIAIVEKQPAGNACARADVGHSGGGR